jgi:hypothetical protein
VDKEPAPPQVLSTPCNGFKEHKVVVTDKGVYFEVFQLHVMDSNEKEEGLFNVLNRKLRNSFQLHVMDSLTTAEAMKEFLEVSKLIIYFQLHVMDSTHCSQAEC